MSFEETLGELVRDLPGAIGAVLMGRDGIPVAQVRVGDPGEGPWRSSAPDVATAAVEFGRVLDEARKAGDAIGGGRFEDCIAGFGSYFLLFRDVDRELVLCVALDARGSPGQARYRMRRCLAELREQV